MAEKNINVEVELNDVRLSFAHVYKAQQGKDPKGKPKFNCSFLLDKSTKHGKKLIERMEDAIEEAKELKWGKNQPRLKEDKICMRDGDDEDWDGYEGMMYVSASNSRRPALADRRGDPTTEEDGIFYSGCYVNGIIRVWCQDNEHGKRVNASLEGIQFVRKGEAFGASGISHDRFADLGEEDDDDSDDRPSKKKSRRDDDEDERPSKKKSRRDDDEEEEKPRKKSRRDDDEEEDERPSKKKSRRDDDEEDAPRKGKKKSRYEDDSDDDDDLI